jgi:hypothetical protein
MPTDGRTGGQKDGWTERGTDVTKLIIASRYFANTPKMTTATKKTRSSIYYF